MITSRNAKRRNRKKREFAGESREKLHFTLLFIFEQAFGKYECTLGSLSFAEHFARASQLNGFLRGYPGLFRAES